MKADFPMICIAVKEKLYAEDGSVIYIGLFENNKYHGHGTLYNILGEVLYTGGFSNGVYDGTGELSSAGLVYSGQFRRVY